MNRNAVEKDNAEPAEAMYRAIASDFGLNIEKVEDAPIELLMEIPKQDGLDFTIMLGLQNRDELNVGVEDFLSYFFPFEKRQASVDQAVRGLISGKAWIAVKHQFGRTVKAQLVRECNGKKEVLYTAHKSFSLPLFPRKESKIQNTAMRIKEIT